MSTSFKMKADLSIKSMSHAHATIFVPANVNQQNARGLFVVISNYYDCIATCKDKHVTGKRR